MEQTDFHRLPTWVRRIADAARALHTASLAAPHPDCVLFISAGEPEARARVATGCGGSFDEAWRRAFDALLAADASQPTWLRVDVVNWTEKLSVAALKEKCSRTKRSYFRFGLSFDPRFRRALLEQEISGNAILYRSETPVAALNDANLARYAKRRFGEALAFGEDEAILWRFKTAAIFAEGDSLYSICDKGREAGYRELNDWPGGHLNDAIASASRFLAAQIHDSGKYDYGWFPCFDKPIPSYNALRHASSTYALLEGWEHTREPAEFAAIERALHYLTTELIHSRPLPGGKMADFLVDVGNEVKLGGNALAILALAKYTSLTGDTRYLPQMLRLARTLRYMQDPETGAFVHVINYPDLSLKAAERIIYYDGEAAFALMRLYGLTGQAWLLEMVHKAFDSFIAREHWRAHDHWLSYCVNELVAYCPEERYFRFGLDNVRDHLDFVLNRITTYPTLLELMMAASQMLVRLAASEHRHLLDDFDTEKFDRALAHRARYLMNGFFWPELAMFFARPSRIVGSFFIRHHAWRVRIDDVEHYLSGLTAWHRMLKMQHRLPAGDEPQVLFLGEDLREVGNGIEVAMLRRAQLFVDYLHLPTRLVLCHWNPGWRQTADALRTAGKLPGQVAVSHVYDALPGLRDLGRLQPLEQQAPRRLPVPPALYRRQVLHQEGEHKGRLAQEDFIDAYGQVLLRKYYQARRDGVNLSRAEWRNERGNIETATREDQISAWLLSAALDPAIGRHFIIDKNAAWRDFALNRALRPAGSTLTAMLHSTHLLADGRVKWSYAHLLDAVDAVDKIVALTGEQRDDLALAGVSAARLLAIPHGGSLPTAEGKSAAGRQVLCMARYAPEKQHALLIRAFALVVSVLPDARLVCYGTGPLRNALRRQVSDAGLEKAIAINDFSADIAAAQRQSRCAVLCSREEGFSLFGLESLGYGTPLVSFDIKYGPRELLADSGAGVLVAQDDERALADALIAVLSDDAAWQKMSATARERAARYAPEAVAERWQDWWQWASGAKVRTE